MRIKTKCKSCKKLEVKLTTSVNDRAELAFKKGKEFQASCKNCLANNKYHVNDFTAESSTSFKLFLIFLVVVVIIFILFLQRGFLQFGYIFIGGIFVLPSVAYGIIKQQEQVKLNSFNRYKTKE